jgi:hypothetical protein
MTTRTFKPWTDLVKLHPDVESGRLTESVFAIDLGAIATQDPNVPVVNRDPEAFFRATYLTQDLGRLLNEVLASLAGEEGYDRVLKLRTPFGGGKSHTLASLLHAARSRNALDVIPEGRNLPRPGDVAVAVFDGEKFDALTGKEIKDGPVIRTMWGWIAWQIDPRKAWPLVEGHDRNLTAPGGDVIQKMLTVGADGRPVLILLDEVLKYMERAASVPALESTLQRQAKDFFQNLTVEVSGNARTAMAYALTWSARESFGNVALLDEIDKLAARVDQQREPVTGDEILPILQRRLLGETPDASVAGEVAAAFEGRITNMRRSFAESGAEQRQAEEEGRLLRERMQQAWPFHPALIDLMRERWTSVEAFQRTRGALRFLASCLHALKQDGRAQPLLGPGDVPLKDANVRVKMLKELGAQNDYDPVITADIIGPNARARRIDERLSRETPALASVQPATRIASAILLYSFGGLRRDGDKEGDHLPPGVTESDLLAACVGPDLDNITATAVLSELRNACLYLHFDGVRYCFKKDPNVTKLIEDAEQEISREETHANGRGLVRERIKEMLTKKLAGRHMALVWPERSQDLPDGEPRFLLGYLPLEFSRQDRGEQERQANNLFTQYGDRPRRYRNGLGLAVPDKKRVEALRRAIRYLLAMDRVETRKHQLRLSKDQLDQLKERRRTEDAAAESSFRELYAAVWLPRVSAGAIEIEKVESGGRPLQATGMHERVLELLRSGGIPRIHDSVTPRKMAERVRLGEEDGPQGISAADVLEAFYRDIHPPRLESSEAIRKGIVRGVAEGLFGYVSGKLPELGADGQFMVDRDKVVFQHALSDDEVDFESGFLMVASAIPSPPARDDEEDPVDPPDPDDSDPDDPDLDDPDPVDSDTDMDKPRRRVSLRFQASRDQVFGAFPAIANLADKSDGGKITISIEAESSSGFDEAWFRNAVQEPLDEIDIDGE